MTKKQSKINKIYRKRNVGISLVTGGAGGLLLSSLINEGFSTYWLVMALAMIAFYIIIIRVLISSANKRVFEIDMEGFNKKKKSI